MTKPTLRIMFDYLMAISQVKADPATRRALRSKYLSDADFRADLEKRIWQSLKTESTQT